MKKWLMLLLVTGSLSAAVEDNARLFSAKAITAANEQLGKVRASTGKEILILTLNDLGGKKIREVASNEGRMRQLNGVIVLISKNPRQLEVMAGRKTSLVFRKEHRDLVVDIFSKNLRTAPDQALANAVKVIVDSFNGASSAMIQPDGQRPPMGQRPPVAAHRESSSFGWVKWLIIIGVIFLIIRLISYFMSRRNTDASAATPGVPGQSGFGGGGFFASLMGGIFGAVAGNWIYDKMFGDSHDHSNYNQDSYRDSSQDWRNDDKGDFDSGSGSGGDWGSGSDDSSGGGGDSGGGGGDSW
jgi:uncharacterized membrane protein YgcG